MIRATIYLLFTLIPQFAFSQSYDIGVLNTSGTFIKVKGFIEITDSTYTLNISGSEDTKKVVNRQKNTVYVTDGTATDQLTITPMTGTVKGFGYDHTINYQQDKRFTGSQVVYFCRLRH